MTCASISLRPALAAMAALCALALAPGTASADLYPIDFCKVWGPDRADMPAAVLPITGIGPIASVDNDCGVGGIPRACMSSSLERPCHSTSTWASGWRFPTTGRTSGSRAS